MAHIGRSLPSLFSITLLLVWNYLPPIIAGDLAKPESEENATTLLATTRRRVPKESDFGQDGPMGLDTAPHILLKALIATFTAKEEDLNLSSFSQILDLVIAQAKLLGNYEFSDLPHLEDCLPKKPFTRIENETFACLKKQCSIVTKDLGNSNKTFAEMAPFFLFFAIVGKCKDEDGTGLDLLDDFNRGSHRSSRHQKIPWQYSLGYGSLFTLIIVLGSQFGGLLYPFRHRLIYKICLTYLIGLAVGTLAGGGVLHLMPHTFGMVEQEGVEYIYKASTILGGVYLFYIVERLLRNISQWWKDRKRLRKEMKRMQKRWELKQAELKAKSQVLSASEGSTSLNANSLSANGSTIPIPASVAFEREVTVVTGTMAVNGGLDNKDQIVFPSLVTPTCESGFPGDGSHDLLILSKSLEIERRSETNQKPDSVVDAAESRKRRRPSETHQQNAIMDEESNRIRLPSHTHAEVNDTHHEAGEIAPIAWIVIMAKAFSSFIDGLSMGAAFTESTLTGVKIAIAIICEEFPHELGDIAILLNSGMNFKQALFSNFCAASPTFFGLCVGISIGENTNANLWIFAIATGMFLYIALVDMVPELNTLGDDLTRSGIRQIVVFTIQHAGILSGFVLMLIMAIYGDDISV